MKINNFIKLTQTYLSIRKKMIRIVTQVRIYSLIFQLKKSFFSINKNPWSVQYLRNICQFNCVVSDKVLDVETVVKYLISPL